MEERTFEANRRKSLIGVLVAMLVVLFAIAVNLTFGFSLVENLIMSWILTTLYGVFVIFLVGSIFYVQRVEVERPVYIDRPVIQEVIRTVTKEVPIQIPMDNQTIKVVDRPVYQRVEVPVIQRVEVPVIQERKIYIERARKKLNIPRFDFLGSSEAKRFHTRNCRLGKLIKNKYKVHSNSKSFFIKKHFKACKVCIQKKKKI